MLGIDAIAAAVRRSGNLCDQPQLAQRDAAQSTSDEEAWLIRCEAGNFRVKFLGDRGAQVERID